MWRNATSIRALVAFSFYIMPMYKHGNADCVHAERYSPCCTLLAPSRVLTVGVIPMSHLLDEAFTQLQNLSPGLGQGFKQDLKSPNTFGELCCC